MAMNHYGWLIELFEAADGKTWTLVATRPGGPACVFGVVTGRPWPPRLATPLSTRNKSDATLFR